ncbi:hypothetical protein ACFQU2_00105 [Siccirubricoccus deserti]
MRRGVAGIAVAGLLVTSVGLGMALAQGKPPAAGAPGGGKPAPVAPGPAPGDNSPTRHPQSRRHPPRCPTRSPARPLRRSAPVAAIPGEPEALTRLRAMLGREVTLTYRALAPVDPAGGAVRLSGVSLRRGEITIGIEELTLDRPGEDQMGEAVALGVTIGGAGATPALIGRIQLEGFRLRRPAAGEALAPGDLTVDLLRLEGLAVQGETPFAIATLTVEDWAAGKPGRFTLTGLDVLTPAAGLVDRLRLGRIALRGYDLPTMLAAVIARTPPPQPGGEVGMEVEDVAATLGGAAIGSLGSLRISAEAPAGGVPGGAQSGRIALRDLRVAPFPLIAPWLTRFGYTELTGDITIEARVDPAAERMDLSSFAVSARGMGGLGLSMQLEGVSTDPGRIADNAERMRLAGATLRYVDQSLFGRWVADQARQQRVPEARLREQYASMAAAAVIQGQRDAGPLAPALAAVQRFLRGQARTLEVSLRPPQPVPVADFAGLGAAGPVEAQRRLGLEVTAQ